MWMKLAVVAAVCSVHLVCGSGAQDTSVYSDGGNLMFMSYPDDTCSLKTSELLETKQSAAFFAGISKSILSVIVPADINTIVDTVNSDKTAEEAATELLLSYIGIMVVLVLILLLACFVPCCGCIFCCCRLCDNCGGKRLQKEDNNTAPRRLTFAIVLTVVALLLGFGCVSVFMGESTLATTVNTVQDSLAKNSEDLLCYTKSIGSELDYLLNTVYDTLDLASEEVNDVKISLENDIQPIADSIKSLDTSALDVLGKLELIKTVQEQAQNLNANLSNFANDFKLTVDGLSCSAEAACMQVKDGFNVNDYKTNVDFAGMLNISSQLDTLGNIRDQRLSETADDLLSQLESVKILFEDINANENETEMVDIQSLTNDSITSITASFKEIEDLFENQDTADVTSQVTNIGFICGTGIAIFIGLIAVCYILGIIFGEIGRDSDDIPTERVCLANCGGSLLIIGWVFALLSYFCIACLAAMFFLFGSLSEAVVCRTLANPSAFDDIKSLFVIDMTDMTNDTSNFLNNLSISSIIENCENDQSLWKAFNLDNLLGDTLDTLCNDVSDVVNVSSLIPEDFDVIEYNESATLVNLSNIDFSGVDFGALSTELSKNLVVIDLGAEEGNITTAAGNTTNPILEMDLRNHATTLCDIRRDMVVLQTNVDLLKTDITTLGEKINDLLQEANNTVKYVDNLPMVQTAFRTELETLIGNLLGYVPQLLVHVKSEIRENIGGCRPLYNLYASLDYILCDTVSDSFNAIWLGLVIAVYMFIFGVIFAVKLSKFYKRMLEEDYSKDRDDDHHMNHEMQNYKV